MLGVGIDSNEFEGIIKRFTETIRNNAIESSQDLKIVNDIIDIWQNFLNLVKPFLTNPEILMRHVIVAGITLEALHLYLLSFWLALTNFIDGARAVLRSSLDTLAFGILLERQHRRLKNMSNQRLSYEHLNSLFENVNNMLEGGKRRYSSPFTFLMNGYPENIRRRARRFYRELSAGVHGRDVSALEIALLLGHADTLVNKTPEDFKKIIGREGLIDFVSFARRREMFQTLNINIAEYRQKFLKSLREAAKICVRIMEHYLSSDRENVGDSNV
ncbi:MAG: hypothetical protein QXN89_03905 [Candidatus Woesearchaeota archaeon]